MLSKFAMLQSSEPSNPPLGLAVMLIVIGLISTVRPSKVSVIAPVCRKRIWQVVGAAAAEVTARLTARDTVPMVLPEASVSVPVRVLTTDSEPLCPTKCLGVRLPLNVPPMLGIVPLTGAVKVPLLVLAECDVAAAALSGSRRAIPMNTASNGIARNRIRFI